LSVAVVAADLGSQIEHPFADLSLCRQVAIWPTEPVVFIAWDAREYPTSCCIG